MNRPAIDHSLLSPSGRMSKRARAAALQREAARLFPGWTREDFTGRAAQPSKREQLLTQAARLRELAARGMSPRKFTREAAQLEQQAEKETA